jgi:hypothetical protein
MKLYSYVMTVDDGFAPNPTGGICTLAYCMRRMRRTVQVGDYVIGLAGNKYRKRRGVEWPAYPIIYAMRVTDVIGFDEFSRRNPEHFNPHPDTRCQVATDRVLIGEDFIYWGGGGPLLPREFSVLIKPKGPGHLCNFPQCVVRAFIRWFRGQSVRGCQGTPFEGWYNHHTYHRRH